MPWSITGWFGYSNDNSLSNILHQQPSTEQSSDRQLTLALPPPPDSTSSPTLQPRQVGQLSMDLLVSSSAAAPAQGSMEPTAQKGAGLVARLMNWGGGWLLFKHASIVDEQLQKARARLTEKVEDADVSPLLEKLRPMIISRMGSWIADNYPEHQGLAASPLVHNVAEQLLLNVIGNLLDGAEDVGAAKLSPEQLVLSLGQPLFACYTDKRQATKRPAGELLTSQESLEVAQAMRKKLFPQGIASLLCLGQIASYFTVDTQLCELCDRKLAEGIALFDKAQHAPYHTKEELEKLLQHYGLEELLVAIKVYSAEMIDQLLLLAKPLLLSHGEKVETLLKEKFNERLTACLQNYPEVQPLLRPLIQEKIDAQLLQLASASVEQGSWFHELLQLQMESCLIHMAACRVEKKLFITHEVARFLPSLLTSVIKSWSAFVKDCQESLRQLDVAHPVATEEDSLAATERKTQLIATYTPLLDSLKQLGLPLALFFDPLPQSSQAWLLELLHDYCKTSALNNPIDQPLNKLVQWMVGNNYAAEEKEALFSSLLEAASSSIDQLQNASQKAQEQKVKNLIEMLLTTISSFAVRKGKNWLREWLQDSQKLMGLLSPEASCLHKPEIERLQQMLQLLAQEDNLEMVWTSVETQIKAGLLNAVLNVVGNNQKLNFSETIYQTKELFGELWKCAKNKFADHADHWDPVLLAAEVQLSCSQVAMRANEAIEANPSLSLAKKESLKRQWTELLVALADAKDKKEARRLLHGYLDKSPEERFWELVRELINRFLDSSNPVYQQYQEGISRINQQLVDQVTQLSHLGQEGIEATWDNAWSLLQQEMDPANNRPSQAEAKAIYSSYQEEVRQLYQPLTARLLNMASSSSNSLPIPIPQLRESLWDLLTGSWLPDLAAQLHATWLDHERQCHEAFDGQAIKDQLTKDYQSNYPAIVAHVGATFLLAKGKALLEHHYSSYSSLLLDKIEQFLRDEAVTQAAEGAVSEAREGANSEGRASNDSLLSDRPAIIQQLIENLQAWEKSSISCPNKEMLCVGHPFLIALKDHYPTRWNDCLALWSEKDSQLTHEEKAQQLIKLASEEGQPALEASEEPDQEQPIRPTAAGSLLEIFQEERSRVEEQLNSSLLPWAKRKLEEERNHDLLQYGELALLHFFSGLDRMLARRMGGVANGQATEASRSFLRQGSVLTMLAAAARLRDHRTEQGQPRQPSSDIYKATALSILKLAGMNKDHIPGSAMVKDTIWQVIEEQAGGLLQQLILNTVADPETIRSAVLSGLRQLHSNYLQSKIFSAALEQQEIAPQNQGPFVHAASALVGGHYPTDFDKARHMVVQLIQRVHGSMPPEFGVDGAALLSLIQLLAAKISLGIDDKEALQQAIREYQASLQREMEETNSLDDHGSAQLDGAAQLLIEELSEQVKMPFGLSQSPWLKRKISQLIVSGLQSSLLGKGQRELVNQLAASVPEALYPDGHLVGKPGEERFVNQARESIDQFDFPLPKSPEQRTAEMRELLHQVGKDQLEAQELQAKKRVYQFFNRVWSPIKGLCDAVVEGLPGLSGETKGWVKQSLRRAARLLFIDLMGGLLKLLTYPVYKPLELTVRFIAEKVVLWHLEKESLEGVQLLSRALDERFYQELAQQLVGLLEEQEGASIDQLLEQLLAQQQRAV